MAMIAAVLSPGGTGSGADEKAFGVVPPHLEQQLPAFVLVVVTAHNGPGRAVLSATPTFHARQDNSGSTFPHFRRSGLRRQWLGWRGWINHRDGTLAAGPVAAAFGVGAGIDLGGDRQVVAAGPIPMTLAFTHCICPVG